jgi:chromate transporter
MNLVVLYLLMVKATVTTLNGPMSLPILRDELVVKQRVITDRELSAAVTAAQSSPGPMGIYVVSVGYFVAGVPGAAAGFLTLVTPAFVAVPLIRFIGRRLETPRARRTLNAAMLASAGLILTSAVPLAQASIHDWFTAAIAVVACVLVAATRVPTVAIIAAAGIAGALSSLLA